MPDVEGFTDLLVNALHCTRSNRLKYLPGKKLPAIERAGLTAIGLTLNTKGKSMTFIAKTPTPPYYAVIFTSIRSEDEQGYAEMSANILELVSLQPGFLGVESAREDLGITISYWTDIDSIKNWKANLDHKEAQRLGHEKWYESFKVRISKVERDYGV